MLRVRTRFAPSPTGRIHLGNVRATLFNALFSRLHNSTFILRIEDTDVVRSTMEFSEALQEDLLWLGIEWQEGPRVGGEYAPYYQSMRREFYSGYYDQLRDENRIYPCFCTDQELNLSRKLQLSRGLPPRYAGTCMALSKEEIQKRLEEEKPHAWRFHVPKGKTIEFVDLVKGHQVFRSDDIGDFIVRRADGSAPFLFCNAVDDALMEVTHVLRGEDHLANTPRQLLILEALALKHPLYGHLSLIVGEDGAPLSKRHGSFSIHELRSQSFLPIAILNYLARLGHAVEASELLSFDELASHFHLEKLSRSAAKFDVHQLLHWQKSAVQHLDLESAKRWLGEKILHQVPLHAHDLFVETMRQNIIFPHEANDWVHALFDHELAYSDEAERILREAGEQYFVAAEEAVEEFGIALDHVMNAIKTRLSLSGKRLFLPLRVALTGHVSGPELLKIAELLSLKGVKKRLHQAFQHAIKLNGLSSA